MLEDWRRGRLIGDGLAATPSEHAASLTDGAAARSLNTHHLQGEFF
jgi:hypothetical protein